MIETVKELDDRSVGPKSLSESIDTTTSGGRLVFHIFGALAEFERELIRERTQAAARARGRIGGRSRKLAKQQVATARTLLKEREHKVKGVAEMLGVSRSTLYRALDQAGGRGAGGVKRYKRRKDPRTDEVY